MLQTQAPSGRIYGARRWDAPPTLVGAADLSGLPAPAAEADQTKWVAFIENQGSGECCVGESEEQAHYIAVGNKGKRISPTFAWKMALKRELQRKGQVLTNQGCDTADAIDGEIAQGLIARDVRDDNPVASLASITPEDVVAAYANRRQASDFVPLSDGDITTAMQFWTMGAQKPDGGVSVTFTMSVTAAYEALNASNPVYANASGPSLGLHRQATAGYKNVGGKPRVIVTSSWGRSHGDGGLVYIDLDIFRLIATDMVAVVGGQVLQ